MNQLNNHSAPESRRHFLVDINTVFRLFGKHYFLIFYFGRHLHPRQQTQLVNQRTAGNWLVMGLVVVLLAGFIYGVVQMVVWRLSTDAAAPSGTGSFTQFTIPAQDRPTIDA